MKKVTHPETIKIIEEKCKTFKSWVIPRLAQLKKLELFKDANSFTPYQKLTVTQRINTCMPETRTRNFSETLNEGDRTLPLILHKILVAKNETPKRRSMKNKRNSVGFSMFRTEFDEFAKGRNEELSNTAAFEKARNTYYVPTKLAKSKIKKIKTNLF